MKRALLIGMMVLALLSARADDSLYRRIAGYRICNIFDPAWVIFPALEVSSVANRRIVCRPFFVRQSANVENVSGALVGHTYYSTSENRVYSEAIVLLNYPRSSSLVPGDAIGPVKAFLVDTSPLTRGPKSAADFLRDCGNEDVHALTDLTMHAVYDVGVDYHPPVTPMTPAEKLAAAKKKHHAAVATFRFHQEGATNGLVSAEYGLGHDYLTGNGTETNAVLAHFWLEKAKADGSIEASDTLRRLSQTNAPVADDDDAK